MLLRLSSLLISTRQSVRVLSNLNRKFSTKICWKCSASTSDLFCGKCNSLQKPDKISDYFQILGIDAGYDVNEVALAKKYKDLQKQLHPDKFSNKSQSERDISAEYSSLVNKAYSTLLNPLSRGIYMLNLRGVEISESTELESKFLHEIMERNERVEEASTAEEILTLEKENRDILNDLRAELTKTMNADDISTSRTILVKMKYYNSINDQIQSMISRMGIVK